MPFWRGKTLEDNIYSDFGDEIRAIEKVVKINQKDHAQGHICPNVAKWLRYGPAGLLKMTVEKLVKAGHDKADFYGSVIISLDASSFSPGRIDQYLFPYYKKDIGSGKIDDASALELIDAFYIKLNHLVYLRNAHSATYFAGFPIGFNVAVGDQTEEGKDGVNRLFFLFLKARDHIRLHQLNLTVRLHKLSTDEFIRECTRIISLVLECLR